MPTIGQMNKRIRLKQPVTVRETSAGSVSTYPDYYETWAALRKISGSRAFDSGLDGLVDNFDAWIRYNSDTDVSKYTKVSWDGKDFGIKSKERIDNNGNVQLAGNIYHFIMTAES